MTTSTLLDYCLKKYIHTGVCGHVGYELYTPERFFKKYFEALERDTRVCKLAGFVDKEYFKKELINLLKNIIDPMIDELWGNPYSIEKIARLNKIDSSENDFDFE